MVEFTSIKENVELLKLGDKQIYLVGTAHVSQASTDLAEEIIRTTNPNSVAVELCDARYQSLKNPERWKNTDIVSVIRQGKAYVLMAQLMLASFQKKLGEQLKVKPGAEMMRALSVAQELNVQHVLADRDITTTLKRTWSALSFWSMCKVLFAMLTGVFSDKKIDQAEIERLKTSDALDEVMREFSETLPEVRGTLIDERDQYLASKIADAPGPVVVAIVGAGHVPGIKQWIDKPVERSALEKIPAANPVVRAIGWLVPTLVVGLIIYGFFMSGASIGWQMVISWILITGTSAALGALLAFGHPLSIATAFVASPLTTIHPFLASGWFAGLVEALLRKPRVSDLETITDDIATMRGLWRNRVSRILLVMAFTNLAGTIGAVWGLKVVAGMAAHG